MTLPSEAPALPPQEKTYLPLVIVGHFILWNITLPQLVGGAGSSVGKCIAYFILFIYRIPDIYTGNPVETNAEFEPF